MKNLALDFNPLSSACLAMEAERVMSSYELLVQDPIKPALRSLGQLLSLICCAKTDKGWARSGVKGPLICGSRVFKSISINYCN